MARSTAEAVAAATGCGYVEAPAGYGKTETIADAVMLCARPQLVLTHTRAGVDSLRKRLRAKGAKPSSYRLETIDSLSLRFAQGYPATSGYRRPVDGSVDWLAARKGAAKVLAVPAIQEHLRSAYGGVIVDEYQDCSALQNAVVRRLASACPVRLLGDPLQRLFTFDKTDPCVDWESDVVQHYESLGVLDTPHRWHLPDADHALGQWLRDARTALRSGLPPDYTAPNSPVYVHEVDPTTELFAIVKSMRVEPGDRIVVLVPMPHQMDGLAARLSRLGYSCMEEIEGKTLVDFCRRVESAVGCDLAAEIIEFVGHCSTQPDQRLDAIVTNLRKGNLAGLSRCQPRSLAEDLRRNAPTLTLQKGWVLAREISRLPGRRIKRQELLNAFRDTVSLHGRRADDGLSLVEAAREIRLMISHRGRKEEPRLVSRPVLVKGLQYEHVVVVDPHTFTAEDLYVAISRGTKSLSIVGTSLDRLKASAPSNRRTNRSKPASQAGDPAATPSLFDL